MLNWVAKRLGIYHLLPSGPVMGPWHRSRHWMQETGSGVRYRDEAVVDVGFPILPVLPFGLGYELDLVIVSSHPGWNMHEYALVRTPEGPIWLAKDAREGTLEQSIVADIDGIDAWMPEVPVVRRAGRVEVEDRSTADRIAVDLAYENLDGEAVSVHFEGEAPILEERKRNGSTMGHSRDQLMAVLDLSHKELARRTEVRIAGVHHKTSRILGLLPFHFALRQTQGGLCVGSFVQRTAASGFATVHPTASGSTAQTWEVDAKSEPGVVVVRQRARLRTVIYRFLAADPEHLELVTVTVHQWGRGAPTFHLALQPALPDLRRGFEGQARSRFVVDVNGQENLAAGTMTASVVDGAPRLSMVPRAPWWVADRPMETRVHGHDDHVHVDIVRVAAAPEASQT